MNWQDTINNSELVYASVPEDKGFITWSLKKTTCNVSFYETFPLDKIDNVIISAIQYYEDDISYNELATILGFNVFDDFESIPKRYKDDAEISIFDSFLFMASKWGLISINNKTKKVEITNLGYKAINEQKKFKFYSGTKILFENFGIKPFENHDNIFFPFHSALGISSSIENIKPIPYENISIDEIFGIVETDLIKRLKLQSKTQYNIYKSDSTPYFKIESCDLDIRLYKEENNYYPIIFNESNISLEATELLNKPENINTKNDKVKRALYLKLIKNPNAILDYETIIPFEVLLEFDSLIKDSRLVWSDALLFHFIAENANANQWYSISNQCPIGVIKMNIERYSEKCDWTSISLRIDDDFLIQNAKLFPWNFEAISAKEEIGIEVIKTLLLIPELKEQVWDWDNIMPQLDSEFIKANIDRIDFELSELTKVVNIDIHNLIAHYPEKRWDWSYISNEYDLSFILSNILNFKSFVNLKIVINRAFNSEDDINLFCSSEDFRKVLLFAKNTTLKDYSPNQSKYIWTNQLISLLETTGFLIWESGRYTSGFECNPFVEWSLEFFKQYHLKITTQKGFDFVSTQISDTLIISEFPDFLWNWDVVSANPNLITDSNFLISVKDKLNYSFLLPKISSATLEAIFEPANILSFLETNEVLWVDITEKSSKDFVLQHIDYKWDWTILTSRFCSTIKVEALGNPKWIDKWDWTFLTQNLDLNVITEQLDQYLERWDWVYLTRKLDKEFVIDNLPDYNEYWSWEILLREIFDKQDLLLSTHLTEVATCISVFEKEKSNELWEIITCKFNYLELAELIAQTFNQELFYWDYAYFYELPQFDLRKYLIDNAVFINWTYLSCSNAVNKTFSWDKSLFSYEVWLNDVLKLLKNPEYKWDFKSLSSINNINWNDTILKIKSDKWDWDYLTEFSKCFKKDKDFSIRFRWFSKFINFSIFSNRLDSEINEKLLLDYIDRDWDWTALSSNNSLKISFYFIQKQKDKTWDWQALSERNDIDFDNNTLIELSNQNWDWVAISNRTDITFSEDLISKLDDKPLDWLSVSRNNTFIPNTKTLSLLKGKTLDWSAISKSKNIDINILWDYKENLVWEHITKNEAFDISNNEQIRKYQDYLDWNYISQSKNFEISFENLKQFKSYLNWESINKRIGQDISEYFLEPLSDVLDWSNVSQSMDIHFTEELIEKYRNKWDWQLLRHNPQVIERLDSALKKYKAEFKSVEFLEKFDDIRETPYIYHFTHLFNAIEVIKNRKILSRNKAKELGLLKYDSAGNVVDRSAKAHPYARFYFRPQTPTQFYNECLGHDSKSGYLKTWEYWDEEWIQCSKWNTYYPQARNFGLPKCPIPVFFKFDLKEVLLKMADKCYYSTGNMQSSQARVVKVSENPNEINTHYLYSSISDGIEIFKEYAQQEFLIFNEFDFSKLKSFEIICYNSDYVNLLKAQLGDDPICEKINADGWDLFNRNNRELHIKETDTEISISSEYRDSAYFSIKGEGLHNIQILNLDSVKNETENEIIAYPDIKFVKSDQPIEVHFVDPNAKTRDWLIYRNNTYSVFHVNESIQSFNVSEEVIIQFLNLEHKLKLKLSSDLFYPHMINSYHGIAHTTRVLFGAYLLLSFDNNITVETKEAILYSVIIHDLGKTSDREGFIHGEKSANLYKEKIKQFILDQNLQTKVIEAIKYHSIDDVNCPQEVQDSIIWKVLKDADALDRGRFNRKCDKSFLRLDIFKTELGSQILEFMENLSYYTQKNNLKWISPFRELVDCIKQINL